MSNENSPELTPEQQEIFDDFLKEHNVHTLPLEEVPDELIEKAYRAARKGR
ncbi:hypothetical protein [Achromobacter insolitus]|uniref:hypothetical protein n=1 Tax=Achromobacter insolitus TaxID=217204 RepID=UPI00241C0CF0|nr:hypothetical protein [Achromobacter insolitus]